MKTYRRIEVTAFRRRVTIVSGEPTADTKTDEEVCINDADSEQAIATDSEEGQRILTEALRLLEERLSNQMRKDFK